MSDRRQFRLDFYALRSQLPVEIRVRKLLKELLRRLDMRAVSIQELPAETSAVLTATKKR